MADRITPRILKGFRDYLPQQMLARERLVDTARRVYRSYGFAPIDTPTLEYLEILTGKGGDEADRQLYKFEDQGGRMVGMRFDLTVPLARFAAQHSGELGMPFKRYHIATVWRGEKPHRGRYREFMQCDFDTIGTKSISADIETGLVIHDLIKAIGFSNFSIRVNNRMVLNGLLGKLDLSDKSAAVLRSLDKLAKIGREKVIEELVTVAGATQQQAEDILGMADLSGTNDEILSQVDKLVAGNEIGEEGVGRLRDLLSGVAAAGVESERFNLDVSIARGLDYYTGTIFETFLDALPTIGSVCSGGRYDNLAELYTKEELPGIGASLGLDRLLAAMEELGMVDAASTAAQVLVTYFDKERLNDYLGLAAGLRSTGLNVEVYPEPKKLGQQLKYADRRGFRVALIAGENEFSEQKIQVKDLSSGEKSDVSIAGGLNPLAEAIAGILGA